MKIEDVLAQVDEIKPNTYDDNVKILWLSELDGIIYNELVLTHVQDKKEDDQEEEEEGFKGYTDADYGTELIAPFPYDNMYREYIFAKIDYSNGESERYANSYATFNSAYKDFSSWFNRTHKPIDKPLKLI